MLDFDQIKELIDIVCERELGGIEVEETGFRLKIDGRSQTVVAPVAAPAVSVAAPAAAPAPAVSVAATASEAPPPDAAPAADNRHIINSPIVGTFYTAPSPDADPYVQVGDEVSAGQVLCIVEAMKLMNEIESDVAGKVVEIFSENGQPVEFGEPLFAVEPA